MCGALLTPSLLLLCPLQPSVSAFSAATATPAATAKVGGEIGVPVIQVHSYKEYKDFGQVWTVLQDRRGILYMGVSAGDLLEYDGVNWRKIITPMSVIRSLSLDETGVIWVGGSGNFGYLSPNSVGTMEFVSILDKVDPKDRGFTDVWQNLVTPQGIFFRSYDELFRWDGKKMFVWHPEEGAKFQALSEVDGHIYTSQDGVGLEEIVGDELRRLPGGDAYKTSRKIFLHPYDQGRMVASARDQSFTLYDGQKAIPFPTGADEYLKKHQIYTSTLLKDGSLCVTTLDGGAVIIEHDGRLRQIIDKVDGLPDSGVLSAYQDRDGALWLGSGYGVSRVEAGSPLTIFTSTFVDDALRFNGSIYIASAASADSVEKLTSDPRTNRPLLEKLDGATQAFRLRVFKDPFGGPDQLLVATSEGILKPDGGKLVRTTPAGLAGRDQSYTLRQSRKSPERVYVGHGDGVGSMRWDGHQWIDEGRLPKLVYEARSLAEDSDGALWVSGGDGKLLRILVPASGMRDAKAEVISKSEGVPDGSSIVEFIDGRIFVEPSRSRDILVWDPSSRKFVVDNRFVLPLEGSDATSIAYEDKDGSVWTSTATSDSIRVGRYFKRPDGSWRLDEDTYRPFTHFQFNTAFADPDGMVWGTGEYLVRLNTNMKPAARSDSPALVRQVTSGAKVIFGGSSVPGQRELQLPAGTRAMSFQYASLSYGSASGISYQYFLQGVDKDWSVWGKQKEANYNGLGPGEYEFRVRSQSEDGRVSPEGDYAFTILPPWYRTQLAYAVYLLIFALITYAAWRLISRYERKKARLRTRDARGGGATAGSHGRGADERGSCTGGGDCGAEGLD